MYKIGTGIGHIIAIKWNDLPEVMKDSIICFWPQACRAWDYSTLEVRRKALKRVYGAIEKKTIPLALREAVFGYYGKKCVYCGSEERLEIDHITALSRGGRSEFDNLVPACYNCNRSKKNDSVDEFIKKIPSR